MRSGVGARAVGALCIALVLSACAPLTVQEEKQLGREVQRSVRQQLQFVRDPVTVNYVRDFAERLVDSAPPSPFEFRFYVIEDEELNAFAVPGGAIYVHTGLIMAVKNASELAGVLAHEIAHVTERHVAQLARRQRNTGVVAQGFAILFAILTGSQLGAQAGGMAAGMAADAYLATYTQDAESAADIQAIDTLIRAGWDPQGMVTMFQTLQAESGGGLQAPQFLRSHPATADRIQTVEAEIKAKGNVPGLRRDDGGRLKIIKKRLELIIGTDVEDHVQDEQ